MVTKYEKSLIVEIQDRLSASLGEWYPDISQNDFLIEYVCKKNYRWSVHYLYKVLNKGVMLTEIIVKYIRQTESGGRSQSIRPEKGSQKLEYEALCRLYDNIGNSSEGVFAAVRPLAYYCDIDSLAMEYRPACDLKKLIMQSVYPWTKQASIDKAIDAAKKGGRLLSRIHQINYKSYPEKKDFDIELFCKKLWMEIEKIFEYMPSTAICKNIEHLYKYVEKNTSKFNEETTVNYLHHDLYPDNLMLLPNGEIYTIDTTLHQPGVIEEDIAKFIIGVETAKKRLLFGDMFIQPKTLQRVTAAFCESYYEQKKYSPRILVLCKLYAFIYRYSNLLEALQNKKPQIWISVFQKVKINPFIWSYLDSIRCEFQRTFQL